MKIGFWFSGMDGESGGGRTYEEELLNALYSVADLSLHSFLVFSSDDRSLPEQRPSHDRIFRVKVSHPTAVTSCIRLLYFSLNLPVFSFLYDRVAPLRRALRKNPVDVMVFLSPIHDDVDIPSVTPVWDLQHRLQPYFPEVSRNWLWDSREKYYRKILPKSSIIVTGTRTGQDEISQLYNIPETNIRILPLPTPAFALSDQPFTERTIHEKYAISGDYLLYPAQFWAHKNHVTLLLALKILHEKHNLHLTAVLPGSDKGNQSYIRKTVSELNLLEYVRLPGFVPRQDLVLLYRQASALVFPTFFGPDNLPPLEAFALKCPVIASDIPGAREQLGDAAVLVDPRDAEKMAEAIRTVLTDPQFRAALIEKGYKRATSWTGLDYMKSLIAVLDDFGKVRRNWQ